MPAKTIQVSDDNGSNWYTLPGNQGELTYEGNEIEDTIFGQNFESDMTGLIGWSVDANGLYKGYAGYVAKIMKSGTPTALTDEAMSLVSGKTYQVTNSAKRCFDRATALVFEDNSTPVDSADIDSIDHLFGRVTFTSGYTVTGPITVASGNYLPLTQLGKGKSFTLTQTANAIDTTDFATAQANSGFRTFIYGLKTVQCELQGVFDSTAALRALLAARSELVLEINPDGAGLSVARGFFRAMSTGQSGDVGELEEETVSFNLSVPDQADVVTPFKWLHASNTTLNTAIQKCLSAWAGETLIDVRYLYDGTNGRAGDAVITDLTLTGGLEAMNEFSVAFQGSGADAAVP